MGNSINTLVREKSTTALNEAIESHPTLRHYKIESWLVPGSGRIMRTYRLRHKSRVEASAVLKAAILMEDELTLTLLSEHQKELERIRETVNTLPHIASFRSWFVESQPKIFRGVKLRTIFLLRSNLYTTLSDRLASRPWLSIVEKLWITHQLLSALSELHRVGVCHGFLTTENIGLTSLNYVMLMDLSSYKALRLRDDDPSEYLFYFQLQHDPSHLHVKRSEKRCYIAPERFYGKSNSTITLTSSSSYSVPNFLEPAMDVFSAGCVITELFLNGERCMDLGDLIEYRKRGVLPTQVQQKLAKIESSHLRAACRHMLNLDPTRRVTAGDYLQRLNVTHQFPSSFGVLTQLHEKMHSLVSPDARIAVCASYYEKILVETVGVRDVETQAYFMKTLGAEAYCELSDITCDSLFDNTDEIKDQSATTTNSLDPMKPFPLLDLLTETEELLQQLAEYDNSCTKPLVSPLDMNRVCTTTTSNTIPMKLERSKTCQDSLLIYLQMILSTIQNVQRSTSKLVALHLVERLAKYSCDESRLQRIIPVAIALLQDQDPLVRASVLRILTDTLSIIQSFSPSDSKIFPQYIFKRVTSLLCDPSLAVRIVFAKSISNLAETALRFLDISHAVRLYEAVGNGSGVLSVDESSKNDEVPVKVFADDLTRLLDESSSPCNGLTDASVGPRQTEKCSNRVGKTLICSNYQAERASIVDIVSKWVVHITTDQSEGSALSKRSLLGNLGQLCSFFGLEGVMAFILPQILAFLNDRENWELRASLFDSMPTVCHIIGRAATEEFVLPCVEIGLVDMHETVICCALSCLRILIHTNLVSKSLLVVSTTSISTKPGLLSRYLALLVHPSGDIRYEAINMCVAAFCGIDMPTLDVFFVPTVAPLLRFRPSVSKICTYSDLKACLRAPIVRDLFMRELRSLSCRSSKSDSIDEPWTSIGINLNDGPLEACEYEPPSHTLSNSSQADKTLHYDPILILVRDYIGLVAMHSSYPLTHATEEQRSKELFIGIEGSVKLAQSVMFPRQDVRAESEQARNWYSALGDSSADCNIRVSGETSIRSIASLGYVYGLSIMGIGSTLNGTDDSCGSMTIDDPGENLNMDPKKSLLVAAAFRGEWGAETAIDVDEVDTTLLVAKLKGLNVPPLPPNVGPIPMPFNKSDSLKCSVRESFSLDWRPRSSKLVASTTLTNGHTAPVARLAISPDNRFFVSGSHDGTCRVWELIDDSSGVLESTLTYSGHSESKVSRVNDVAMVEGAYSVVSGSSDGNVHVWRIDTLSNDHSRRLDKPKVIGSSCVRKVHPDEGEVLHVAHFNSLSSSVVSGSTQKGIVHAWDLRCRDEPFQLEHGPELGYLTSTALGSDRQWVVTGTNRGFLTLWDIRFQRAVKLLRHSSHSAISRLAASVVTPPHTWGSRSNIDNNRPYIFVASGVNECGMFDVLNGSCCECFRSSMMETETSSSVKAPPSLVETPIAMKRKTGVVSCSMSDTFILDRSPLIGPVINCMAGSIGGHSQSFLITGSSDSSIRFWDFATPSNCCMISGFCSLQRQSYERIDFDEETRIMLCRDYWEVTSPRTPSKSDLYHTDSILDLKIADNRSLISCSRDNSIKVWR